MEAERERGEGIKATRAGLPDTTIVTDDPRGATNVSISTAKGHIIRDQVTSKYLSPRVTRVCDQG